MKKITFIPLLKVRYYIKFNFIFIVYLLIGSTNLFAQDPTDCIHFTDCPSEDITICADTYNPNNPSEWGAILQTWTVPTAEQTCIDNGSNGNSFFMDFTLNEQLLGVDCWDFNYVQRIGKDGGYLKLFSSQTGPNSYIITPYLYLDTNDTASIQVTYTDGDYDLNVYYIDSNGNTSPIQDTIDIDALGVGVHDLSLDLNIPIDGSYRVKYEFVYNGSAQSAPSGTNHADKIGIGGIVVDGQCTSGIEFTVSGPEPPQFLPIGDHTLVYTATYTGPDGTVYTESCSLTVHVIDTPPVFTCPAPITQEADNGLCTAIVTVPTPTVTDTACDGTELASYLTVTSVRNDGLLLTDPYPLGETTVTHTATDPAGNEATCIQTVTIIGGADPSFNSQPSSINDISCSDSLPTQETLTAYDCNGPVTVTPSVDNYTVDKCNGYTITYRWTAGASSVTQSFNVLPDTTPPTWDTLANDLDRTLECSDSQGLLDAQALAPTASDLCDSNTLKPVKTSGNFVTGSCANAGTYTNTWTVFDECNNEVVAVYTQTITVKDTTAPVAPSAPANASYECTADVPAPGDLTAVDNCEGNITVTGVDSTNDSDPCNVTITRTWTFTDSCNNSSSVSQTITVKDTTAPVIDNTNTTNIQIECGITDTNALQNWLDNHAGATASDNCSNTVTWANDYGQNTNVDCNGAGITVTFTATDACGNHSSTTANYLIKDTTPPAISTQAANMTVECDGNGNTADLNAWLASNGAAAAADDCSAINWSNDFTALSDDCGETGSATVIFTATDNCGNTSTTSATFTIKDTTPPTISTDAANMTVECDGSGNTEDLNAWLANNGGAVAEDTCSGVTWTNDFSALSDDCGESGSATVIFTATDDCGNTSTTSATFKIEDTTAPTFTAPAAITINCDQDATDVTITGDVTNESDNCSSGIEATYTDEGAPGDCANESIITRTWTLADACGNTTSHVQTINIIDNKAPVLSSSLNGVLNVSCDNIPDAPSLEFTDNCSATVHVDFNEESTFDESAPTDYQITRTWTASDDCGNSKDFTQILNVTLDEVVTTIDAESRCYDDGVVDLNDYLQNINSNGTWEMISGDSTATLEGSIFDPTSLEVSPDFLPNDGGIDYLFKYTTTENGCISVTSLTMNINADCTVLACGSEDIVVSKAVTPNGDQWNEYFEVGADVVCGFKYDVKIFNRWGALVYESKDYQNNWNGYTGKGSIGGASRVPNGTYYYIVIIKNSDGSVSQGLQPLTGPVYLGTK